MRLHHENPVDFSEAKYGRNVVIHAIFSRHGEKELTLGGGESILTAKGRSESSKKGSEMQEHDAIKGYSSDTDRTRETAELTTAASPTQKKMRLSIRHPELGFHYDEKSPFFQHMFSEKKRILGEDFKQQSEEEQNRRMVEYSTFFTDSYNALQERPDPVTFSPKETAAVLAARINRFINMADKLESGSEIDAVNATHDFNLASFLREMIGFRSVSEVGGPIKFNESFEVRISTDEAGNTTGKLIFREKEYPLDMGKFKELLAISEPLMKEMKINLPEDEEEPEQKD